MRDPYTAMPPQPALTACRMTPVSRQLAPPAGWAEVSPRVPELDMAQRPAWLRGLQWGLRHWGGGRVGRSELPRVFLVLLHHPRLFWPWLRFAARLMPLGCLARDDTELAILRASWNCRCRYEWGQHVVLALAVGLTPEQIARVARGPDASGWSPAQAALLRATDDLHQYGAVSTSTWQQLAAHYNTKQLIEIPMLVGHYQMLAGWIHSLGVTLEPEIEQALARAPIHATASAPP